MITGPALFLAAPRNKRTITATSAATVRRAQASGGALVSAADTITSTAAAFIPHATAAGVAERSITTAGAATIQHATASAAATITPSAGIPTFISFVTTSGANPATQTVQVGDLMVGMHHRGNNTAAVPDAAAGWTQWGSAYSGNGSSLVLAHKTADSTSEEWGDWVQTSGRRCLWIFRDAAIGVHSGGTQGSGTSFTWPALSIADDSLVCCLLACLTNQTSLSLATEGPSQMVADRLSNNTALALDTDTTLLSTFTPGSAKTLDTASIITYAVFSVVGE